MAPDWVNTPVGTQAARARVRELKAAGVDAIKLHYTDLTYVTKQPQPMLGREILAAVIDEAHRQGLKAYVHAPILQYAKQALEAGADGLVHGIVSDPIDAELVTLMKRNSAVLLTTHSIFYAAADLGAWAQRLAAFERSELIPRAMIQLGMQPDTVTAWGATLRQPRPAEGTVGGFAQQHESIGRRRIARGCRLRHQQLRHRHLPGSLAAWWNSICWPKPASHPIKSFR